MTEAEYDEIRTTAERHRMTVSEWVRLVLRDARDRDLRGRPATVHEATPQYGDADSALPRRVRVEIDIKEDLLEAVRERYRLPNWRAAVEYALGRAAVRPMSREEALAMQGVGWEGDLDEMRSGDPGDTW